MDSTFSQALELNGMSTATIAVVWLMIIFLVALLLGIGLFFKGQIENKKMKRSSLPEKNDSGRGF